MDPVTLATITSAVTLLATECAKGLSSEAGKSTWNAIKSLFKWDADPGPDELAKLIAQHMEKDPEAAKQVVELLQADDSVGGASALVGNIDAQKVVVAGEIDVKGNFNM